MTGQGPFCQFWQLAVETGRQIGSGLPDLLFDQVIVVDQPFGGGRDGLAFSNSRADFPIGHQEGCGIVVEPVDDGVNPHRVIADELGFGQAAGVLLRTFRAKDFRAD